MNTTINTNTYIFNFGHYNGKTYSYVLKINPSYLYWCHNKVKWFTLEESDLKEIKRRIQLSTAIRAINRPHEAGDYGYIDDCDPCGPGGNSFNLDFG